MWKRVIMLKHDKFGFRIQHHKTKQLFQVQDGGWSPMCVFFLNLFNHFGQLALFLFIDIIDKSKNKSI